MKQKLIDIVFTFLGLSLSLSYWFHRGGSVGSWGEVRQNSLNSNYDITLSRGGWARFPPLWSNFWPSFTCVYLLLLGWKGCSISSMKKDLFDIVFTSSVVFTISYWFHLGERVGWLFRGGPARFPQLWSYYSSFMFLSVVARVEGLSHKDHEATSFWHFVHSFGCLSLFCKLDATTVHEINPKRNPQIDAPKFCKRTPNTWLWGTPI